MQKIVTLVTPTVKQWLSLIPGSWEHHLLQRWIASGAKGAAPPRFHYHWLGDDTLVMTYESKRGLAALMPSLIRGVGQYYGETLEVERNGDELTIQFPARQTLHNVPSL